MIFFFIKFLDATCHAFLTDFQAHGPDPLHCVGGQAPTEYAMHMTSVSMLQYIMTICFLFMACWKLLIFIFENFFNYK